MRPPEYRFSTEDSRGWPLHIKEEVTIADIDQLSTLPVTDERAKAFWETARGWLSDVSYYDRVQRISSPKEILRCRLPVADVKRMQDHNLCRKLRPGEVPMGTVDLFPVAEPSKIPPRRRRIGHTVTINRALDKSSLQKLSQPSRRQQLRQALDGEFCISLDFSAYFDAFEVQENIQMFYCFRVGEDVFCLTRLPMGQRQSVEVAQGATNVLLSFDHLGATSQSCIDNVRFVGKS